MSRTKKQTEADRIDLELHRLVGSAKRQKWNEIALAISRARVVVRKKMHREDRAKTV